MLHLNFIRRQLTATRRQSIIFVLCVALSMTTLIALRGFGESVNRTLLLDAKALNGADVRIESHFPFSSDVIAAVNELESTGALSVTRTYEFYSVVRAPDEESSLLVELKVVEESYPLYGDVTLQSGRPLRQVLRSGQAVVEQNLLDRLGLQIGDDLLVGQAALAIVDVVVREPDRPVNFFAFGPRLFVAAADLASLDLIKPGSHVHNSMLLRLRNDDQLDRVASGLAELAEDAETVETYLTAESGVQRFLENFLFFLGLVGIFTLLLAGIGIQSALTAFLRERTTTIAVVKTLGATRRYVTLNFLAIVAILGFVGIGFGLLAGFALEWAFPILMRGLLPPDIALSISLRAIGEGLLVGFVVVAAFSFLPLYRLEELRPSYIFRKETSKMLYRWPFFVTVALILLFFGAMVLWQIGDRETGLYFIGGSLALLAVSAILTEGTLWVLRRRHIDDLALRQALRGLFRPRNATRSIVITLSASLAVIFCIFLIEQNLDANFVQSYPEDAPNVFFLDIQPDQQKEFARELGIETDYFPVVRASVTAVNGIPVDREAEEEGRGPGLSSPFNLTYRDTLRPTERLTGGDALFREDLTDAQVSVLKEVMEFNDLETGDLLSFRVQGVPVDATIVSVRSYDEESVEPFFSFVFRPQDLADAPQTLFTALRVEEDGIAALQNRMVAAYPNVSVIDVTAAIDAFAAVARRLSQVIRFFTLFSVAAGVLIVISSVYATRLARIKEAVYYKVLGARSRFVLRVFSFENMLLGLVSALLALLMAQIASWIIATRVLDLAYHPQVAASAGLVIFTVVLVTTVGLLASRSILRQRPIVFLREQTEEE